jgi:tetratricopeptide (TPR) repeat protein
MSIVKRLLPALAVIVALLFAFRSHWAIGLAAAGLLLLYGVYSSLPTIYAQMGNVAYLRGDQGKALSLLEKASGMRRALPRHHTAYAYLLLKAGQPARAEQLLTEALREALAGMDRMQVKLNLATAFWLQGKREEAIALLEETHEEYRNTTVYGNLGYFKLLNGNLEEALAFNLEAYEYNDNDLTIMDNVAQNYFLLGRMEEAAEMYGKVIAKAPKHAESYYYYARTLIRLGRTDDAREQARLVAGKPLSLVTALTREQIERLSEETGAAAAY